MTTSRLLRSKLGAWRGHHVVNGRYAMAYGGPAELHLGRAAAHLGLVDDAIADLEQAVKSLYRQRCGGLPRRGTVRARLGTGPSLESG